MIWEEEDVVVWVVKEFRYVIDFWLFRDWQSLKILFGLAVWILNLDLSLILDDFLVKEEYRLEDICREIMEE